MRAVNLQVAIRTDHNKPIPTELPRDVQEKIERSLVGFVKIFQHKQEGLRYVYVPSRPRALAARSALRSVLRTFFEGSLEKFQLIRGEEWHSQTS